MIRAGFFLLALFGLSAAEGRTEGWALLGTDPKEFSQAWETRGFPLIAATHYDARLQDGQVIVTGVSENANRAAARRVAVKQPTRARLTWSWRVRSQLDGTVSERTKAGDDFAARVFVIFETSVIPTRTRAINYVWAANEPVDSVFPSPYTRRVAHIVLQTAGHEASDTWRHESRDVLADYRKFFGESPSVITAVAIMVDTDNTDGRAEADFRHIVLEIQPPPEDSRSDASN